VVTFDEKIIRIQNITTPSGAMKDIRRSRCRVLYVY